MFGRDHECDLKAKERNKQTKKKKNNEPVIEKIKRKKENTKKENKKENSISTLVNVNRSVNPSIIDCSISVKRAVISYNPSCNTYFRYTVIHLTRRKIYKKERRKERKCEDDKIKSVVSFILIGCSSEDEIKKKQKKRERERKK